MQKTIKGELCQGSGHSTEQNLFKRGSIISVFIAHLTLSYWVKIMWALIAQLLRVFGCITGCVPRCWGEAFLSSSDYCHNLFPYKFITLGQELLLATDWRLVFGPGAHAHLRAWWASLSLDCWGGPWDKQCAHDEIPFHIFMFYSLEANTGSRFRRVHL